MPFYGQTALKTQYPPRAFQLPPSQKNPMQTHRAVNWTAGALLFTSLLFATQPGWAAGPQMLRGHVPAGAAKLQPTGRLLATQKLDLVIGLPLRNRQEL